MGNHILPSTGIFSFVDLVEALANQHDKQCIGGCAVESGLVVGNQTQSNLAKRTNYYNVDWASYNYDGKNYVDAYETLEYPGDSYSSLIDELNAAYQSLGYPDKWKYCLCTDLTNDGAYGDLGTGVGLVGEVYFNTYCGVDGYCTDNHCGAQCQTDGCQ